MFSTAFHALSWIRSRVFFTHTCLPGSWVTKHKALLILACLTTSLALLKYKVLYKNMNNFKNNMQHVFKIRILYYYFITYSLYRNISMDHKYPFMLWIYICRQFIQILTLFSHTQNFMWNILYLCSSYLTKLCACVDVCASSYFFYPNKQADWHHKASFLLRQNIEQTNIYSGLLSCDT